MSEHPVPELVEATEQVTAAIRDTVAMSQLTQFFDGSYPLLGQVLAAQGVAPTGAAYALYRSIPTETVDLELGFPTAVPVTPVGTVSPSALPGGRLARVVHTGSFDGLAGAWQNLMTWVQEQGLTPGEAFWEVYLTEPHPDMDPAELRTELNLPVS